MNRTNRDRAENLGRDLIVRKWLWKMRRAVNQVKDQPEASRPAVLPFPRDNDEPKEAA